MDGLKGVTEVVILDVVGGFLVPGIVGLGLLGELETELFDLLLSGELVLEVLSLGGLRSSKVGPSLSESIASLLDCSGIGSRESSNLGSGVLNGFNTRLAVGVLLVEGIVDLELGLSLVEGVDVFVDTKVVLLGSEPSLELVGLELESSAEVVKLLLSGELVAKSLLSGILRRAEVSPVLVNAGWGEFFWWDERWTMLVSQLEGDVVEQGIQIDLFCGLWWLDGGLVALELSDLLLGTSEGVVEVSVLHGLVGGLDPVDQSLGSGEEVVLEGLVLVGNVDELSNTTSSNFGLLAAGEVVVVLHDVSDDGLFIRLDVSNVFNIEKLGDAKRFGDVESELEVVSLVVLVKSVEVDEVRSVLVDDSAERKTVLPREVEVVDGNISVAGSLLLAPQEKSFLGAEFCCSLKKKVGAVSHKDCTANQKKKKSQSYLLQKCLQFGIFE